MDARIYETQAQARGRRLYARRCRRQLDAAMPYHISFLSRRRRMADRDALRLMQLVVDLAAAEERTVELLAA